MKTLVESVSHYAYRRRSRFFVLEASCLSEPLTRVRLIAMKLSRPCLLLVCVVMAALGQPGPPGPGEGPSQPPVAHTHTPGAGPNAANNLAQAIWLYLQGGSSAGGPPGAASGLPPPAPFGPVAPHGAVASTRRAASASTSWKCTWSVWFNRRTTMEAVTQPRSCSSRCSGS